MDFKALAEIVLRNVRDFVQPALDELNARIDALPVPKDGRDGADGKDGAPGARGEAGPPGEKGERGDVGPTGERGEKGDPGEPGAVGETGSQGERGEKGEQGEPGRDGRDGVDGKDGQPGERGADGAPGRDGIDGKDGAPGERGDSGPPGRDGDPGPRGEKGDPGEPGQAGKDGSNVTVDDVLPTIKQWFDALPRPRDGIDGKSVTLDEVRELYREIYLAEQAKWALDFERRATERFDRFLERLPMPKDGRDGLDGLGFDDFRIEHDGERTFTWIYERADQRKDFAFKVPCVIERGVWKPGSFERGDGVTKDGSYWIARRDTDKKPGDNNDDWRLAVKKGRDGKDADQMAARGAR